MNSTITKLAAAAAVVLALLAGVIYFSSSFGSAVVWAEVAEKIEQTQNYSYRIHMTMSGDMMTQMSPEAPTSQEIDGFVQASTEYGMRMENNLMGKMQQRIYFLPEEQAMIHKEEVLRVLEKASRDALFVSNMLRFGSDALDEYNLTGPEKLAILTGDIPWIEKQAGPLTAIQRKWLEQRLSAEIW